MFPNHESTVWHYSHLPNKWAGPWLIEFLYGWTLWGRQCLKARNPGRQATSTKIAALILTWFKLLSWCSAQLAHYGCNCKVLTEKLQCIFLFLTDKSINMELRILFCANDNFIQNILKKMKHIQWIWIQKGFNGFCLIKRCLVIFLSKFCNCGHSLSAELSI